MEKGRQDRISKQISSKKINIIISNITKRQQFPFSDSPTNFPLV